MKIRALLAASLMATTAFTTTPTYAAETSSTDTISFVGQQGAPLMKGLSGPEELADLIDKSLAKDSSGDTLLDAARCKLNGSCATPNDYLTGFHVWHPNVSVTLEGLAKYIRGLHKATADGEYYSARMVGRHLDLTSGFKRKLMQGEYAWFDTQTGDAMLFSNCGNIMKLVEVREVVVVADRCKVINAYTDGGGHAELAVAIMLREDEEFNDPYHCLAHKLAGETDWTPGLPKPCHKIRCDFGPTERQLGLKAKLIGVADQLQEGDQQIRVPAGTTTALCYYDAQGVRYRVRVVADAEDPAQSYFQHGKAWVMRTAADNPAITYMRVWTLE